MKKKLSLSYIIQSIRSFAYVIFVPLFTIPYSFICIAAIPLPFRYRNAIIVSWTRVMVWALKVLCNVQYRITGLENIPKNRNGIVMCKHQSTWETFFLPGLFHYPAIILKRELLWIPFFGWGASIIQPIAINRSDKSSAMEQVITKGKRCLDQGRWIIVFPEGTRIAAGKCGKYRLGGARLATATGYPIIPVAHNAGRFWPKRGFYKKPGTIDVVIGPLIETQGRAPEEVLEETKQWIEDTMRKLDPLHAPLIRPFGPPSPPQKA